jgi:predicted enzyme related to lactoylglutathione lyase
LGQTNITKKFDRGVGNLLRPSSSRHASRIDLGNEAHQGWADARFKQLKPESNMQIKLSVLLVSDQDKALDFYTKIVGFTKTADVDLGPMRWLTLASPEGAHGVELLLEKTDFPPAQTYQKARYDAGIPIVSFTSNDIHAEYDRLKKKDVKFRGEPADLGPILSAVFEDGCGNLVHLVQAKG